MSADLDGDASRFRDQDQPEQKFEERLIATVNAAGQLTPLGTRELLEWIRSSGGVTAARAQLSFGLCLSWTPEDQARWAGTYFRGLKAINRLDLSVEVLCLDPQFASLFTVEEKEIAALRLTKHDFCPSLASLVETTPHESHLPATRSAQGDLLVLRRGLTLDFLRTQSGHGCEVIEKLSQAFQNGTPSLASAANRCHLKSCPACRGSYPQLLVAYSQFDVHFLQTLEKLLEALRIALDLTDERLEKSSLFSVPGREAFEDEADWEGARESCLDFEVRPSFVWRAVRLASFIGHYMDLYEETHERNRDMWALWRTQPGSGRVSDFVRDLDRETYVLGQTAKNVFRVLGFGPEAEYLWLPTDGDLAGVEQIIRAFECSHFEDWDDILGERPKHLNCSALLYLSYRAAEQEAGGSSETGPAALFEQLHLLDRKMAAVLDAQTRTQETVEEIAERQDAVIDQLDRLVEFSEKTDTFSCEESVVSELGDAYGQLDRKVRQYLIAAEQVYRTRDFAAPGMIVQGIAAALERHIVLTILPGLFARLKDQGKSVLLTPTGQEVWSSLSKPEMFSLGAIRLLFRHPEPAIADFCHQYGLKADMIWRSVAEVVGPRNSASHGIPITFEKASAIREQWFAWRRLPGGVFAAVLPSR